MDTWRSRFALLALFVLVPEAHDLIEPSFPNTPEGTALYHASASAADFMLLYCAPYFVSERLCDDIQATCIASVVINFVGYCAYMADAPPIIYDILIAGLCYAQYLRLLFVGRHDADYYDGAVDDGADCVRA